MKITLISSLLAVGMAASAAQAQSLQQPRALNQSLARGVRTNNGTPGPNYWQNHGRYTINLDIAPPNRTIRGREEIVYTNNSPDTLRMLVFKLFMNIHAPAAPRDYPASANYLTSGVHIDSISVNGQPYALPDVPLTWRNLPLKSPLMPKTSANITVQWHYDLALQPGREGVIDSTTFYVAYFYPRVAVYDDYNGWDRMDFTDDREFYSDFNDYDVTVNVPRNFVVWGTGTLSNLADVVKPEVVSRFNATSKSDTTVHIATIADMRAARVTADRPMNSWHFVASNIPDVAFGLSDHYAWDGASVVVDTTSQRRASVQAAYNDTATDFHHMVQYARTALSWLSRSYPGVPYPYEKMTVFQGGAGMEYPMMANDEAYADSSFSKFVVMHEIAHTYFPFYMGINETRYGFMDEAWATALEFLFNKDDRGIERATQFFQQFRVNGWIRDPSIPEDVPIITPGDMLKGAALGNNEYGKAALGYLAVKDMLGDQLFKRALHTYIDRWHGRHPTPWDFFNAINAGSGQNLNWFWKQWFFESTYIDLKAKSLDGRVLTVDNMGGMPAPFDIQVTFTNGSTQTIHETAEVWQSNLESARITIPGKQSIKSVSIEGGIFVDATPADNDLEVRGT